jgi:hypothetical protein
MTRRSTHRHDREMARQAQVEAKRKEREARLERRRARRGRREGAEAEVATDGRIEAAAP